MHRKSICTFGQEIVRIATNMPKRFFVSLCLGVFSKKFMAGGEDGGTPMGV